MILKKVFNIFAQKPQSKLIDNLEFSFSKSSSPNRLLIFVENINATYYLSFHYVLQLLYQQDRVNFFVVSSNTIEKNCNDAESDITALLNQIKPTVVILSRYGLPYGKLIQNKCQLQKIPTIYHIDDNLLEIPLSLGAGIQKQHGNSAVIEEREYLLANTDLIYTSTQYLGEKLNQRFPNQKVYYGIYAPYLASFIEVKKSAAIDLKKTFKFGYMGSKGHRQDLEMISGAIAQIMIDYPDVIFETFGTITVPDKLKVFGNRIVSHNVKVNYEQFLQYLYELDWDLGLAPLENTEFNKCKAPTKYIEYTACQIPTLASNFPVYNQFADGQEIVLAQSDRWYEKIKSLIDNPQRKSSLLENAQKRCDEQFNLKVLEQQIGEVVSIIKSQ
ncbi:glycosyltransferase family protein [Merismopedia glauca]|uniref:Spore protein YkvP/CgeB glycosyl transferase-like domain-containing protein n=1 Tax=Merismopedia glauca CCAP 1448/3 TaxID=1296344 RepID=A0A2T1C7I9_9CYAN|nr:glycosyltransferase [Merismopedia glauca]PSB04128.1 hypothetical protein C7B64_05150 [Merismopedia glauca CCAP 1448/3]